MTSPSLGTALICAPDGTILETVIDELHLVSRARTETLQAMVDPISREKMDNFVETILQRGAAFLWEINAPVKGAITTLNFFGVLRAESIFVIASHSSQDIFSYYDDLLLMVNEQATQVRSLQKELVRDEGEPVPGISLDEFSRLNNELVTTKRELTRKNLQLRQQEARFQKIINENADALLIVGEEGRIRFANPAARSIFGNRGDDLLGRPFGHPLVPDVLTEIEIPRNGHPPMMVEMRSARTHWEERPAHIVSLRDVTERKRMEALREDVDRMSRHDLKTPLNAIIGLPQLLRMDKNLTVEQREMVDSIEEAGYRMLNLINISLALFRMEEGAYEAEAVEVDLVPLLRKIVAELDLPISSKALEIDFFLNRRPLRGSGFFLVLGEELLCYTMFANLLKNAVEAAPPSSRIAISMVQGEHAVITIHNKGAVHANIRETFFEKYVTSGKKDGTGLGTYSARLIARTQNGDVTMTTDDEHGTTVTVTLPTPDPLSSD